MTALKPIENRLVRAVASERYPLNKKCAHPECNEAAVDPHHAFPRSAIGGDSWFVEILDDCRNDTNGDGDCPCCARGIANRNMACREVSIVPHVTGLCRAHHDAVEEHDAWIKFEDGMWNWYDREVHDDGSGDGPYDTWIPLGPLNPQPGSVEGKPKRRKYQGEARKQRKTVTIRVPDTADENGAALLDEAVETLEARISGDKARPIYFTVMDALNFTLLNAGADDFGGDE